MLGGWREGGRVLLWRERDGYRRRREEAGSNILRAYPQTHSQQPVNAVQRGGCCLPPIAVAASTTIVVAALLLFSPFPLPSIRPFFRFSFFLCPKNACSLCTPEPRVYLRFWNFLIWWDSRLLLTLETPWRRVENLNSKLDGIGIDRDGIYHIEKEISLFSISIWSWLWPQERNVTRFYDLYPLLKNIFHVITRGLIKMGFVRNYDKNFNSTVSRNVKILMTNVHTSTNR